MRSLKQIIKDIFKIRNGLQVMKEMLPPRALIMNYVDFETAKSEGYEEIGKVHFDHMDEPYTQERSAVYQAGRYFHIRENLVTEFLDIRFSLTHPDMNPNFSIILAKKIS